MLLLERTPPTFVLIVLFIVEKMQFYVIIFTGFAAFGGFMFGYDIGYDLFVHLFTDMSLYSSIHPFRVINGVKDMDGFRETMNLTKVDEFTNNSNDSEMSCAGSDQNENALLVK